MKRKTSEPPNYNFWLNSDSRQDDKKDQSSRPGDCVAIGKMSFRTYVRNLKTLKLFESRFLASHRNDKKVNYDTVSGPLSHYPFIRKAEVIAVADNNMIQNFDVHELSGGGQFLRKFFIFRAGRNVRAGVIVNADNRSCKFLQGRVDDFPHNRHGVVDCACGGIGSFDDSVVAVEISDFKDFGLEVAHLRHENVDNL